MTTFKVGDRVRLTERFYNSGILGTVCNLCGPGLVRVSWDDNGGAYRYPVEHLVLVENNQPAKEPTQMFKVGDRVKHIHNLDGGAATVCAISEPEFISVRWDTAGGVYKHPVKNLILIQPSTETKMIKQTDTTWKFTYNGQSYEVVHNFGNDYVTVDDGTDSMVVPLNQLSAILQEIEGDK